MAALNAERAAFMPQLVALADASALADESSSRFDAAFPRQGTPPALDAIGPAPLQNCSPNLDSALVSLLSSLHFGANEGEFENGTALPDGITIWGLSTAVERGNGNGPPLTASATAQPLFRMRRPTREQLKGQLWQVLQRMRDRTPDRAKEILAQVPPLYPFWVARLGLTEEGASHVLQLMYLVQRLAAMVSYRYKSAFSTPRPYELSTRIMPLVGPPGHSSFPSGHSTEAWACAIVLGELIGPSGDLTCDAARGEFEQLARRIGDNRVVAGLHFPIDNVAGEALGRFCGAYVVGMATGRPVTCVELRTDRVAADLDPFHTPSSGAPAGMPGPVPNIVDLPVATWVPATSALAAYLWRRAKDEVKALGFPG
jgi:hypothetical protein